MTKSAINQAHTTTLGRFVLGVFVLAWLNVAAQPCLMAMEAAPDIAVPAERSILADHAHHAAGHDDGSDQPGCGHCPPGAGEHGGPCSTSAASGCADLPAFNFDGKQTKPKPKDSPQFMALPSTVFPAQVFVLAAAPTPLSDVEPLKCNSGPSLNIRYCVFLK